MIPVQVIDLGYLRDTFLECFLDGRIHFEYLFYGSWSLVHWIEPEIEEISQHY
jgi:hypothetical protein